MTPPYSARKSFKTQAEKYEATAKAIADVLTGKLSTIQASVIYNIDRTALSHYLHVKRFWKNRSAMTSSGVVKRSKIKFDADQFVLSRDVIPNDFQYPHSTSGEYYFTSESTNASVAAAENPWSSSGLCFSSSRRIEKMRYTAEADEATTLDSIMNIRRVPVPRSEPHERSEDSAERNIDKLLQDVIKTSSPAENKHDRLLHDLIRTHLPCILPDDTFMAALSYNYYLPPVAEQEGLSARLVADSYTEEGKRFQQMRP
jgi:hypothetical protein